MSAHDNLIRTADETGEKMTAKKYVSWRDLQYLYLQQVKELRENEPQAVDAFQQFRCSDPMWWPGRPQGMLDLISDFRAGKTC